MQPIALNLEYVEDRGAWACFWHLDFVKLHHSAVYGRDPIESLTTALWLASELVKDSGVPELHIWWRKPGDNGGLQEIRADEEFRNRRAPQVRDT